jgi:hypothetical protein
MSEEKKKESDLLDAVQELTKTVTELIKEQKKLKETIDLHFKAGRF